MNWEVIAMTVLGMAIASTKAQTEAAVDAAAAKIVEAIKDTNTQLDDTAVRDALVPALKRLVSGLEAGLTP